MRQIGKMNNTANNRDVSLTCSKELLNLFEKESRENSKVPLETLGILMGKKTGENSFSVENLLSTFSSFRPLRMHLNYMTIWLATEASH